ncbi:sensor histidine kinase [Saccharopolyspora sp. 5N708]|uniref:sensor histidine kinase n=1 Tax=Saccharopolyspora sp. 5N708 TaxID=3457424 RepID=UPI003FD2BB75
MHGADSSTWRRVRWLRGSRYALRVVYLLTGSALALSFGSIDLVVADALWDRAPVAFNRLLVAAVVVVPPTLLGFLPQLRHLEGAAATSLLGVDFRGHPPGPPRTWDQRWRTVTWFWAHLLAGGLAGAAVVGGILAVDHLVRAVAPHEAHLTGLSLWGFTGVWGGAVPVSVVWLLGVASVFLALFACGALLARLAPALLGPSVSELLAELETRTTHLVERTRLARELHDSVGHALTVVVLETAVARRRVPPESEALAGSLETVETAARRALEDLDAILGLLREDREAAQRQPVHDLSSLDGLVRASREGGQRIVVSSEIKDLATLPSAVSREAYRIVQEGVTNALRHAPGQPVRISLGRRYKRLHIQVTNPVAGAGPAAGGGRGGGRGLAGVRERVHLLGGRMRSGQRDGTWHLDVTLPVPEQEEP